MSKEADVTKDLVLSIYIQPNAHRNEVVGHYNEALKIKIQAPAVDGKANKELLRFLADIFDIPPSAIQILKGEASRRKQVLIQSPRRIPEFL